MENREELIEQISYSWLEGMSVQDLKQFYLEHTGILLQSLTDKQFQDLVEEFMGDE